MCGVAVTVVRLREHYESCDRDVLGRCWQFKTTSACCVQCAAIDSFRPRVEKVTAE